MATILAVEDPDPGCPSLIPEGGLLDANWLWEPDLSACAYGTGGDVAALVAHGRSLLLVLGGLLIVVAFAHLLVVAFRVRGG